MSFWTQIGTVITDVTMFKKSCEQHNVEYQRNHDKNFKMQGLEVHATLTDSGSRSGMRGQAFLCKDGGAFKIVMDNDINYSSFSNRIGRNGGVLVRDYTRGVILDNVRKTGGMVTKQEELKDGSVLLRVANF